MTDLPRPAQPVTGRDRRSVLLRVLLFAGLPAVLALLLGVLIAAAVEEPFADLVRDLNVTSGLPLYVGALSNLTVMIWTAGASVALTTALAARHRGSKVAQLLLVLGLLGLAFAADDAFQVHDGLVQIVGLPGNSVLVGYLVVISVAAFRYRGVLTGRPEAAVLLVAAVLLATSVGIDVLVEALPEGLVPPESPRILAEDGTKLVGAAVWSAFLILLARRVEHEQD